MMASKNLLSGQQLGAFESGMGADLKQQLLDEEEARQQQLKAAGSAALGFGGGVNNMASMALLGAGSKV